MVLRKTWPAIVLLGLACGCGSGDTGGAREVSLSKGRPAAAASRSDAKAAIRPPRAIATH
jgi:hypothetical protein